ncbi:MAG: nuclear transport factor 2 family protein [Kangiellaceae bacterium]|nr:nuclear transport factor 2 family protein [Kangiellaceae bacterium]
MKTLFVVITTLFAVTLVNSVHAEQNKSLKNTVLTLDKKMFEAFNTCDLKTMSSLFDQDLEFYHDKGGLTNYSQTMQATKNNCEAKLGLVRTLLPEHTAIFPAGNYGAIQEGQHQFCHMENGKNECGTFKFVHVWKKVGDHWRISRIISYDH